MVPLYATSAFYNIVAGPLMYTFYGCFFMKAEEAAISALKRALGALNLHLTSNTYLVGHSVTLADIIMTCNLYPGFSHVMTKSFTSEFPHVERYFWTMVNQPNVKKVMGEVKQAESVVPVTKKPSQPKEPTKSKSKDEPKKEVQEKEPAKPKAEPAAEEEEAPKPKPKNPLDLLPPSKMIIDDWKRLYSNTKTNFREVAIKGTFLFTHTCSLTLSSGICYFQIAHTDIYVIISWKKYQGRFRMCIFFFRNLVFY